MKFVNLTPHEVNICDADGTTIIVVPASGMIARVDMIVTSSTTLADTGISVEHAELGYVYTIDEDGNKSAGMPAYNEDTVCIVSRMVLDKLKSMDGDVKNVYATGKPIRDEAGRVVGCIGLSK